MKLEITAIISALVVGWSWLIKWTDKMSKYIQPIVESIDKLSEDGKLTSKEKKQIAKKAIQILEQSKEIKLNFITRRGALYLVNKLAQKLPKKGIQFDSIVNDAKKGEGLK